MQIVTSAQESEHGSALFSACGQYRYRLTRHIGHGIRSESCLFIMLNPSTADAESDDPTIVRCLGFARTWGHGEVRVVNLFALRSTNPMDLRRSADPVGPFNDQVIKEEIESASAVVAAWGNHGRLMGRSGDVLKLLHGSGTPLFHLGLNRTGEPRHPLYVRSDAHPQPLLAT